MFEIDFTIPYSARNNCGYKTLLFVISGNFLQDSIFINASF